MMAMPEERDEDRPRSAKDAALSVLMGLLALSGFLGAVTVLVIVFDDLVIDRNGWDRGSTISAMILLLYLWIGGIGVWGLKRLKPWARRDEPVSPAARKTNKLFTLSGLVAVPGCVVLMFDTVSVDNPFAIFSNSPVSVMAAILAIAGWLLSMPLAWWWYVSADEHEREAYDAGSVVGAGFFTAVTPAWWIAARAGLAPQPDAMVLWLITMAAITLVWFWRRYR